MPVGRQNIPDSLRDYRVVHQRWANLRALRRSVTEVTTTKALPVFSLKRTLALLATLLFSTHLLAATAAAPATTPAPATTSTEKTAPAEDDKSALVQGGLLGAITTGLDTVQDQLSIDNNVVDAWRLRTDRAADEVDTLISKHSNRSFSSLLMLLAPKTL